MDLLRFHRSRRYSVAAVIAIGLVAGGMMTSAPVATGASEHIVRAFGKPGFTLQSSPLPVRSSSGQKLHLEVTVGGIFSKSQRLIAKSYGFQLSTTSTVGQVPSESHTWYLVSHHTTSRGSEPKAALFFSSDSDMHPFGKIALRFRPGHRRPMKCDSGQGTVVRGRLSGRILVRSRSKAWGNVGSKTRRLRFGKPNVLSLYHGCIPPQPGPATCKTGQAWQTYDATVMRGTTAIGTKAIGGQSFVQKDGSSKGFLYAYRDVQLPNPTGADRVDQIFDDAVGQTFDSKLIEIDAGALNRSKLFSGDGDVSSNTTTPNSGTAPCRNGKLSATDSTRYYPSNWANVLNARLTSRFAIGGDVSIPNAPQGSFIQTYKTIP